MEYKNEIFRYLLRRCPDRDTALDLLQNVFMKLITFSRKQEVDEERVRALLYRIARSCIVDNWRRYERYERVLNRAAVLSHPVGNDTEANGRLIREVFNRAMEESSLSDRQTEAMALYFVDSRKKVEIAEILGVSRQTLDRDLIKGIAILKDRFKAEGLMPDEI